jgi:hypothetical protein
MWDHHFDANSETTQQYYYQTRMVIKRCVDDEDTSAYYKAAAYAAGIASIYNYFSKRVKSGWRGMTRTRKMISMQHSVDAALGPLYFHGHSRCDINSFA